MTTPNIIPERIHIHRCTKPKPGAHTFEQIASVAWSVERENDTDFEFVSNEAFQKLERELAEAKAKLERSEYVTNRAIELSDGDIGLLKLERDELRAKLQAAEAECARLSGMETKASIERDEQGARAEKAEQQLAEARKPKKIDSASLEVDVLRGNITQEYAEELQEARKDSERLRDVLNDIYHTTSVTTGQIEMIEQALNTKGDK